MEKTLNYIFSKIKDKPKVGIILGTGLNNLWKIVENPVIIEYKNIPDFVVSTAPSHQGRLIFGTIQKQPVVLMQGRVHLYEGYSMKEVTYPIRVMAKLGIKYLFVTNAAGSLKQEFSPGSLILIKDHINFMGNNPLIGKNDDNFGERFTSLHDVYDANLRASIMKTSEKLDIKIREGVYCAVTGPSFETRAECQMIKSFGADLVGMSTVPEVIVAKHSGLRVVGISVVTNYGNIFHSQAHTQAEIRKTADEARVSLETLIITTIKNI